MSSPDPGRAISFGTFAEEYARWRPSYPDEAVRFLSPMPPAVVLDLGSGTGQVTGALLARGLTVHAVDPDLAMLRVLARGRPAAQAQAGTAESLPFRSSSLDAVVAATAFHWFSFEEAVAELQRVLRSGGWLGLVYNLVTPVQDWEFALAATNPDYHGASDSPEPSWPLPPGTVETLRVPWDWHVSPEHFRGNLATNSAVMRLPDTERLARLDEAESIVQRACEAAGSSTVPIHLEAFCLKWTPSSASP